jgi:hypothetical protein
MRKLLVIVIFGVMSSCGSSVKDYKGKWIDEEGTMYYINSAGDNKLIVVIDFLTAHEGVYIQNKEDNNKYSKTQEDHTGRYTIHSNLTVIDKNNIRFNTYYISKLTGIKDYDDINNSITRVNE